MIQYAFALLVLLCLCASATATSQNSSIPVKPTWLAQYEADLTFRIPAYGINEPIHIWYDETNGLQRIDYYNGQDSYVFEGKSATTYQTMPVMGQRTCYFITGDEEFGSFSSVFPNLTDFEYAGKDFVNNVHVHEWKMEQVESTGKVNSYSFYTAIETGRPLQYQMHGYNNIFGSHYDDYVIDYGYVREGALLDGSVFDLEGKKDSCLAFPGEPGMQKKQSLSHSPFHDINRMHPSSSDNVDAADAHFDSFVEMHGRDFEVNTDMYHHRKTLFKTNTHWVNSLNRQQKSYTVSLNHMADYSLSEIKRHSLNPMQALRPKDNGAMHVHQRKLRSSKDALLSSSSSSSSSSSTSNSSSILLSDELPKEWDWRVKGAVSRVQDQGSCGSCWSFGAHQQIESAYFLKTGKLVELSSQFLVDCGWPESNFGCNGGQDFQAYKTIMRMGGIPAETSYPYNMANGNCEMPEAADMVTSLAGYVNVTSGSEEDLMDALVTQGPISIAIQVTESMVFYNNGVFDDVDCKSGYEDLNHAVLLVGYGTSEEGLDYWIVKNSWSPLWGDDGYIKIARKNNLCGVATCATYTVLN